MYEYIFVYIVLSLIIIIKIINFFVENIFSIWSRQTKRKKQPCLWCVLYTVRDPQTQYLRAPQGGQLLTQINKCKPINGEIVD
jgi:hypothetical protein